MPVGITYVGDLGVTGDVLANNVKQANFIATVAPTTTDDSDSGYAVGSVWIDVAADKSYICVDATVGAAIWNDVTAVLAHAATHFTGGSDTLPQLNFFNGTFLESFDALVTSDGATITMSLELTGGGDLTMVFSDGHTTLDTTPAATIALTAGTDTIPQTNYIYIPQATKVLTKSTTGFPSAEHIKVGYFNVQSASLVNTGASGNNWVLANQNWNDHVQDPTGQGHMSDLSARARREGAQWFSGCAGTASQDGNDLWVSIAAGVVYQIHPQTFAALDSDTAAAGDPIVVINDPDAAYTQINSLNSITKRSDGVAISNNKYVKFVLWAVANKSGAVSPMFLNLPSGEYNSVSAAERDVDGYANFTIPAAYNIEASVGFLVAAFVCKHTTAAMELQSTEDLRGQNPNNVAGSGTGGGDVTAAGVLIDNRALRGDGGAKGIQDSTVVIGDDGVVSIPGIGDGGLANYDLNVGDTTTPDYGMIRFGDAVIGRTSYNAGAVNLDGAVIIRNMGGAVSGNVEFVFIEMGGGATRLAIPKSGAGLHTYHPRSMVLAGPAPTDTQYVEIAYWQAQALFHNLVCNTAATGAEFGVQGNVEFEKILYVDDIAESTPAAGVTVDGRNIGVDGATLDTAILDGDIGDNGLLTRTAAATYTNRSVAVDDAKLTVSNGDGVAGNPSLGFGSVAVDDLSNADETGVATNKVLKWNGSNWVPGTAGDTTEFTYSIATFSDNEATTQLIGSGVWEAAGAITFDATYNNGPPTAASITMTTDGGGGVWGTNPLVMDSPFATKVTGDATNYPTSKDKSITFTLNTTPADSDVETVTFRNLIWWGHDATGSGLTEADIEALASNAISNDTTRSMSITGVGAEYVVFAHPASYTTIKVGSDYETDGHTGFTYNGIAIAMTLDSSTLSITNSAGFTENYKVYVSDNASLGDHTLVSSSGNATIDPLYYGKTTETSGFSEADIEGLANSEVTNDNTQIWDSITTGSGEYMLFAFPKRLGLVSFWIGGFEGGFEAPETVSVTNANGYTEDYYAWRSTNANLGATVVETRTP